MRTPRIIGPKPSPNWKNWHHNNLQSGLFDGKRGNSLEFKVASFYWFLSNRRNRRCGEIEKRELRDGESKLFNGDRQNSSDGGDKRTIKKHMLANILWFTA